MLLWPQHRLHKWSHSCEPKFPKCPSVSLDRRSPDVSWTFEHRSFLPCPQSRQLTWPGDTSSSPPRPGPAVAVAPKGAAPARVQRTPSQLWLSPERALSHHHHHRMGLQASLVAPVSRSFLRDLALFTVLLLFLGLCW